MCHLIGWIARVFVACLALTLADGCRRYAAADQGFQWGTRVQTFLWWAIAIAFLITRLNKLHLIWLLSPAFFSAQFIAPMRALIVPLVALSET